MYSSEAGRNIYRKTVFSRIAVWFLVDFLIRNALKVSSILGQVTQYDVELFQRVEHFLGKKLEDGLWVGDSLRKRCTSPYLIFFEEHEKTETTYPSYFLYSLVRWFIIIHYLIMIEPISECFSCPSGDGCSAGVHRAGRDQGESQPWTSARGPWSSVGPFFQKLKQAHAYKRS